MDQIKYVAENGEHESPLKEQFNYALNESIENFPTLTKAILNEIKEEEQEELNSGKADPYALDQGA